MALFARQAGAVKVHVAAGTRIEARAERGPTPNGVVVRGTLRDDVGSPIAESHVAITFHAQGGTGPALALPWPKRCPETARTGVEAHEPHVAPDEYVVDTDSHGSFCFETTLPVDRAVMKLGFRGSPLYDATSAETPVELGRSAIAIAFDPEPTIVSLDRPTYSVGLRVTAPGLLKTGWRVKVSDEKGRALGSSEVDPDGLSRVEVPTERSRLALAPASFERSLEGAAGSVPEVVRAVERHARVELEIEEQEPGGVPEDGIVVAVRARIFARPGSIGIDRSQARRSHRGSGTGATGKRERGDDLRIDEELIGHRVASLPARRSMVGAIRTSGGQACRPSTERLATRTAFLAGLRGSRVDAARVLCLAAREQTRQGSHPHEASRGARDANRARAQW